MTSQGNGRPLPKFGEWDVNNPASAEGFTVIFAKARDEKKATGTAAHAQSPAINPSTDHSPKQAAFNQHDDHYNRKRNWLCCISKP